MIMKTKLFSTCLLVVMGMSQARAPSNVCLNDWKVHDFQPMCAQSRYEIEPFTRFSESMLWKLMMSFYDRNGIESWKKGIVPHYVTSNAYIGHAYARVIQGYLQDGMRPNSPMALDPEEPLYIIELGAGTGMFSHFVLKFLLQMEEFTDFPIQKVKYVMTDFTSKNLDSWANNPSLQKYFEMGVMDYALFDATEDTILELSRSGTILRPKSVKNPIVIIGNYLFDTLYHDAFQIHEGEIKEGLVSVGSMSESERDSLDPAILERMSNYYEYNPTTTKYYDDEEHDDGKYINTILKWYKSYFKRKKQSASFMIPIGSIRALRHLLALSSKKAIVLSADKGITDPNDFEGLFDPQIAVHGSFSVMVNYHALGVYAARHGGFALYDEHEEADLKVASFVFLGKKRLMKVPLGKPDALNELFMNRSNPFPHMRASFESQIQTFGPIDYYRMKENMHTLSEVSLEGLIGFLKLSRWDFVAFHDFREKINELFPKARKSLKMDLLAAAPTLWSNYFHLNKYYDIAFEIGMLFSKYGDNEKALEYFQHSLSYHGHHTQTYFNMGLNYFNLGTSSDATPSSQIPNMQLAIEYFNKARDLDPSDPVRETWIIKATKELEHLRASAN